MTLPPPEIQIAENFPTIVALALTHDPEEAPYYSYAEIVSDKGIKRSLLQPDFFEVFSFIDISSKVSMNSQGNPSILVNAKKEHVGNYTITQFYGELGTVEMY